MEKRALPHKTFAESCLNKYLLIAFFLLFCLLIYVFFRTDKTIVNQLLTQLISKEDFIELQHMVRESIPLNDKIIYSLPSAAWVFCTTLTSKFIFVKIKARQIQLRYAPIAYVVVVEILQYFGVTNGYFDFLDLLFSSVFWAAAAFLFNFGESKQNLINPINANSLVCVTSYLIVFLSVVVESEL